MATMRTFGYPLSVKNGSIALSEDFDTIRDAIFSVLEVRPGERVMRSRFGSPDFVFDAIQPQAVISRIQTALEEQIPNVGFDLSGEIQDDGTMQVRINWEVDGQLQTPIDFELKN